MTRRPLPDLSLYLVLDPALCGGHGGMVDTACAAVRGGAQAVQLRLKEATTSDRIAAGQALKAALAGSGALLIVNDDLEATLAIRAAGLHVGQGDLAAAEARARLGPEPLLGVSVHSEATARALDAALVDYAGAGPIFATPTKSDAETPTGWDGLARICAAAPVPCIAIGGLKAHHAAPALSAGAMGLAVVSAICGQPDPESAARAFSRAIAEARP
ncbi:MAG: thiamine phosphate synthase [Rhodobacteraceae bacterium]|nr:thiamine phosphate synthase [Paracoccaceae bacterium]